MITRSASAILPQKSLLRLVYAFSQNMYHSYTNFPLQNIARTKSNLNHLLHVRISSSHHTTHPLLSLQSHATRPPAGSRRPPISTIPIVPRPLPSNDSQQPSFLRLSKFLRFSPRTNTAPVRHIQPRDPLDVCFLFLTHFTFHSSLALQFPATLPLPSNRIRGESAPSTSLPGGSAFFSPTWSSSGKGNQKTREPKRKPIKVVDVPLGQATYVSHLHVHWTHEF
jgi:hypothetical protein